MLSCGNCSLHKHMHVCICINVICVMKYICVCVYLCARVSVNFLQHVCLTRGKSGEIGGGEGRGGEGRVEGGGVLIFEFIVEMPGRAWGWMGETG